MLAGMLQQQDKLWNAPLAAGAMGWAGAAASLLGFLLLWSPTHLGAFDLVAVLSGVFTAAHMLWQRSLGDLLTRREDWLMLAFALFVGAQTLLIESQNHLFGLTTLYLVGVYFLIRYWHTLWRPLAAGYAVGAVFSSALAVGGYLYVLAHPSHGAPFVFWNDAMRVSVLFDDPVVFGAYLVPAFLALMLLAATTPHRQTMLAAIVLGLLVFIPLLLSGARGAWLNAISGGLVLFALGRHLVTFDSVMRGAVLCILFFLLALLVVFTIPIHDTTFYANTVVTRKFNSDFHRVQIFEQAPEQIFDRALTQQWLGSGNGTYEQYSPNGFSSHNTYLRVLFEQGWAGLMLFLAFVFFWLTRGVQTASRGSFIALLLVVAVSGMLAQSIFVDSLHWRHLWTLLGLLPQTDADE